MEKISKIYSAISGNNIEEMHKALSDINTDINLFTRQFNIPLLSLALQEKCCTEIIKLLIISKCKVNEGIHHEMSTVDIHPLVVACKLMNYEAMQALIESGSLVDAKDSTGMPLVHLASTYSDVCYVKLLIDSGADPHVLSPDNDNLLHTAIAAHAPYEIIYFLLKSDVNPQLKNKMGKTALEMIENEPNSFDTGIKLMVEIALEQKKTINSNTRINKEKKDLEIQSRKAKAIEKSISTSFKKLHACQKQRTLQMKTSISARQKAFRLINTETKLFGTPLDCPICFKDFNSRSKILQCLNGHVICMECHRQVKQCPQCEVVLNQESVIRNRILENIVSGMKSNRAN